MDPNKRIPLAICAMLLAGILVGSPAQAARLDRMYDATVPIADRSDSAREDGFRRALEAVLVRVIGDRETAAEVMAAGVMGPPRTYVQQYGYEQRIRSIFHRVDGSKAGAQGSDGGSQSEPSPSLHLSVRFDSREVSRALSEAGVPQWGPERPQVLLWLAVEQDGDRQLLASSSDSPLRRTLDAVSEARGLPVVLPLMDLQDQQAVEIADVWAGFEDRVLAASERYQSQAVLTGRIHRVTTETWRARWRWYGPMEETSWEVDGADAERVLGAGLEGLADRLGSRYALVADPQSVNQVKIVVSGVRDFRDFGRLEAYLRDLSPVQSTKLLRYDDDGLRYEISSRGDPEYLIQAIALGDVLVRDPGDAIARSFEPRPEEVGDEAPAVPYMRFRFRP